MACLLTQCWPQRRARRGVPTRSHEHPQSDVQGTPVQPLPYVSSLYLSKCREARAVVQDLASKYNPADARYAPFQDEARALLTLQRVLKTFNQSVQDGATCTEDKLYQWQKDIAGAVAKWQSVILNRASSAVHLDGLSPACLYRCIMYQRSGVTAEVKALLCCEVTYSTMPATAGYVLEVLYFLMQHEATLYMLLWDPPLGLLGLQDGLQQLLARLEQANVPAASRVVAMAQTLLSRLLDPQNVMLWEVHRLEWEPPLATCKRSYPELIADLPPGHRKAAAQKDRKQTPKSPDNENDGELPELLELNLVIGDSSSGILQHGDSDNEFTLCSEGSDTGDPSTSATPTPSGSRSTSPPSAGAKPIPPPPLARSIMASPVPSLPLSDMRTRLPPPVPAGPEPPESITLRAEPSAGEAARRRVGWGAIVRRLAPVTATCVAPPILATATTFTELTESIASESRPSARTDRCSNTARSQSASLPENGAAVDPPFTDRRALSEFGAASASYGDSRRASFTDSPGSRHQPVSARTLSSPATGRTSHRGMHRELSYASGFVSMGSAMGSESPGVRADTGPCDDDQFNSVYSRLPLSRMGSFCGSDMMGDALMMSSLIHSSGAVVNSTQVLARPSDVDPAQQAVSTPTTPQSPKDVYYIPVHPQPRMALSPAPHASGPSTNGSASARKPPLKPLSAPSNPILHSGGSAAPCESAWVSTAVLTLGALSSTMDTNPEPSGLSTSPRFNTTALHPESSGDAANPAPAKVKTCSPSPSVGTLTASPQATADVSPAAAAVTPTTDGSTRLLLSREATSRLLRTANVHDSLDSDLMLPMPVALEMPSLPGMEPLEPQYGQPARPSRAQWLVGPSSGSSTGTGPPGSSPLGQGQVLQSKSPTSGGLQAKDILTDPILGTSGYESSESETSVEGPGPVLNSSANVTPLNQTPRKSARGTQPEREDGALWADLDVVAHAVQFAALGNPRKQQPASPWNVNPSPLCHVVPFTVPASPEAAAAAGVMGSGAVAHAEVHAAQLEAAHVREPAPHVQTAESATQPPGPGRESTGCARATTMSAAARPRTSTDSEQQHPEHLQSEQQGALTNVYVPDSIIDSTTDSEQIIAVLALTGQCDRAQSAGPKHSALAPQSADAPRQKSPLWHAESMWQQAPDAASDPQAAVPETAMPRRRSTSTGTDETGADRTWSASMPPEQSSATGGRVTKPLPSVPRLDLSASNLKPPRRVSFALGQDPAHLQGGGGQVPKTVMASNPGANQTLAQRAKLGPSTHPGASASGARAAGPLRRMLQSVMKPRDSGAAQGVITPEPW